jgi:sortase A
VQLSLRGRLLWTVGNLMMLIGVYLLLYVGGLFADEQYNLLAAQGGSDIALPETVVTTPGSELADASEGAVTGSTGVEPEIVIGSAPRRFVLPQLNNPGGGRELNSLVPKGVGWYGPSTVERVVIPKIAVDRKVVEVGWTLENQGDQQVAIWEVAKYAVGHHAGSANPSQGGNIVLAGHSGGRAYPFNDIYYLAPGDTIQIWSNNRQYDYRVTEQHVLDEIGPNVTLEQRIQNAKYIEPTPDEVVTLVTCWPLTGPDKFNQRVVIRAVPAYTSVADGDSTGALSGGWTVR